MVVAEIIAGAKRSLVVRRLLRVGSSAPLRCCRFDRRWGAVAQLVERWLPKPKVAGSRTVFRAPSSRVDRRPSKSRVAGSSPAAGAGALGTRRTEFPRRDRRGVEWAALRALRKITRLPRVAKCRLHPHADGVGVLVRGNRAHFGGLQTCGSVWACPLCSAKIQAERTDELTLALERAHQQGWKVALLTLTMRHRRGQRLADLWDALSPAWRAAIATDRRVRRAKQLLGVQGWVRRVECTHGPNGWHLHVHALVFFDGDPETLDGLRAAVWAGWRRRLGHAGLDADEAHGIDLRLLSLEQARAEVASYLNKTTYEAARAARELAGQTGKTGRQGNRNPFDVLSDLVALGLAEDLAIWREWEHASRGRRALTWSKGLRRQLLADEPERTDEELADATDGLAELVAWLPKTTWRALVNRELEPDLLAAIEHREHRSAYDAADAFLTAAGLPPPLRPPP